MFLALGVYQIASLGGERGAMARVRIATPTENIPEISEVGTPLYLDSLDGTNGVRIIEAPLYVAS